MFCYKWFINSVLGVLFCAVITVAFLLSTHVDASSEFKSINRKVHVCWQYANFNPFDEKAATINKVKDIINNSWGRYSSLEFIGWNSCYYNPQSRQIKIIYDSPLTEMNKESLPASMHRWPKGGYDSENNTITLRGDESNRIYMTLFGLALGFAPEARRLDVFRAKITEYDNDDKKLDEQTLDEINQALKVAQQPNEAICTQIDKPLPVYDPENHFIQDKNFIFDKISYKEWQKQAYNPYSVMNACISDTEYENIVELEGGELLSREDIRMLQKAFGANIPKGHQYQYSITDLKLDAVGRAVINDSVYTTYTGHFEKQMPQMTIPKNSKITFKASVSAGDSAVVTFRFLANRSQNTGPSFDTKEVTVSGDEKQYEVDVPAQDKKLFNLFIMNIEPRFVGVKITEISIEPFFQMRNKHLININKKSDFLTGFYKHENIEGYHFYNNGVQFYKVPWKPAHFIHFAPATINTDIERLNDNEYFVFTYTKDVFKKENDVSTYTPDDQPKSLLFKKQKNSNALLPVQDPLLICGLDDDGFVLTDPNARDRKRNLNLIKEKFLDIGHIRIIKELIEELNSLEQEEFHTSNKIRRAYCESPIDSDSDSDSQYDIFYYDDPYGHMGEVITLFCKKTEEQTKTLDSYTFVDLNKEEDCVNFKEVYLDAFVASDWKVFLRGNGFNGRLYGLPNSYFKDGNYNYDKFVKALTQPLARQDFYPNIFFTGTVDPDVYHSNKNHKGQLDDIEPGYYIKGIEASVIKKIDIDDDPKPSQEDSGLFALEANQNITYALLNENDKGNRLYRNGTPFTGSYYDLRNNDDHLYSYVAGYIDFARTDDNRILTINDFGGLSVLTFPFSSEKISQNFHGFSFDTTSKGMAKGYYVKSFPAHRICLIEKYCIDSRKGEAFKAFSYLPKEEIYAFVDMNPCTNKLLSDVSDNCSNHTPDEVLYDGDQPYNGFFHGEEYTNGKLN